MLLPLFVLPAAAEEIHTVDFPIVGSAPGDTSPNDTMVLHHHYDGVAQGQPNVVVASDWSYVSCAVASGSVDIVFSAKVSEWPTSWPATATCSAGGHTLVMNLVDAIQPWHGHDRVVVPSVGITLDMSPVDGHPRGGYRVYDLPVGPNYQEGTWLARLSPSVAWTGVQCSMAFAPNGNPTLQVFVRPSAEENEGYCVLESVSGVPHAIALEIIR